MEFDYDKFNKHIEVNTMGNKIKGTLTNMLEKEKNPENKMHFAMMSFRFN
jgi:hypothetical protein